MCEGLDGSSLIGGACGVRADDVRVPAWGLTGGQDSVASVLSHDLQRGAQPEEALRRDGYSERLPGKVMA